MSDYSFRETPQQRRNTVSQQQAIDTESQSIARAMAFTHFNSLPGVSTSSLRIVVSEDNTPFLAKNIVKRQAWSVEVDNVSLKLKSAVPNFKDRYVRTFFVVIDQQTGQLLRITSESAGTATDLRSPPTADTAETQLRASGETYHDLPLEVPKVSFLDALDAVLSRGKGSPFLAQRIRAAYVIESDGGAAPRPVWAITLEGIPPMQPHGRRPTEVPAWQRDHIRNIVDATSGAVLFATTIPQPQ
jgi:hypothetical protein